MDSQIPGPMTTLQLAQISAMYNPPCTSEPGSSSSSQQCPGSASAADDDGDGNSNVLVREIQASKVHWSELSTSQWSDSEDDPGESNREIFERLRCLPEYQYWLNCGLLDNLKIGQKLAEGGQAEIYELKHKCCEMPPRSLPDLSVVFRRKPRPYLLREMHQSLEMVCSHERHRFVLKVFKKGYSLKDLQYQWPQGIFTNKNTMSVIQGGTVLDDDRFAFLLRRCDIDLRKLIDIAKGVANSAFWIRKISRPQPWSFGGFRSVEAFLTYIRHLKLSKGRRCLQDYQRYEPRNRLLGDAHQVFSDRCTHSIMCHLAWEMSLLHNIGVLHRDLKASNVLCSDTEPHRPALGGEIPSVCQKCHGLPFRICEHRLRGCGLPCRSCRRPCMGQKNLCSCGIMCENCWFKPQKTSKEEDSDEWRILLKIADFESSVGVVGTGFWRAPEILQQLKEGSGRASRVHFTHAADVYSYAMTCYEILTGRIPFHAYKSSDFDHVLRGVRPTLPDNMPPWTRNLIERCWHQDPLKRPTFIDIWQEIVSHGTIPPYDEGYIVLEKPDRTRFW